MLNCSTVLTAGSRVRRHYLHHDYADEKKRAWNLLSDRLSAVLSSTYEHSPTKSIELKGYSKTEQCLHKDYLMPKKKPDSKTAATAADIERSIQALNRMAERLWGDGRETEAKALLDALDALNRALDRIRIGESRRVVTLH